MSPSKGAAASPNARSPRSRERLLGFQRYFESIATPFEWRFTTDDLAALMRKLDAGPTALAAIA